MKITTFLILVGCLQVSAAGNAQKVTLLFKDAPLKDIFAALEKQTNYTFFCEYSLLQQARKVTIDVKGIPFQEALDRCLNGQPLSYTFIKNTVLIKPTKKANTVNAITSYLKVIDIKGRVVDENGKPVPGVTVSVKGTKKQTLTDENGEFRIADVSDNAVLSFSSVNMEAFEINVSGQKEIVAKLKTKTSQLDEVQIIAYGQTTKRFQTGNVTTIDGSEIEKQPVSNPLLALQGRVPGLFITQANGLPGGGVTVRIQGRNSINYGNDPLYVIDGVPFFNQLPSTGNDAILGNSGFMTGANAYGNPLSYVNPDDIESISILKDADATAIYGSRAANGAIIITTKKGKAGQMRLDIKLQSGWGKVANKWDMLNTRQYLDMRYEALNNDGILLDNQSPTDASYHDLLLWDTTRYTDWQEMLIGGTARYDNYSASVSGGGSNVQYMVSGTYRKETTVFPGRFNDQKGSMHLNLTGISQNQKLRVQFSGSYLKDYNRLLGTDLTLMAVQAEPIAPELYSENGELNWAPDPSGNSTWNNPAAELLRNYKSKTTSLVSNLQLSFELVPNLFAKSSLGYTSIITTDFGALPLTYFRPEERIFWERGALYGNRDLASWIFEPQLNYVKKFDNNKLDVLLGGTLQQNNSQAGNVRASGFNSDDVLENMSAAAQAFPGDQYSILYKYSAFFGRINFIHDEKYIIDITGRRDGSSRFGPNNRFQNFGSLAGAWIFTQEKWLKTQRVLSFGKVRASYGITGSDQIGDYAFLSLYNFLSSPGLPYQNAIGITPRNLFNPDLQWEETRKLQAGIDIGLFSDKLFLSATFVRNRSSNQILSYALPYVAGFSSLDINFPAKVENTLWEFSINSTNIKRANCTWHTNINLTIPKNKLISFPNIETSSYASGFGGVIIGQPLGITKTLHSLGVDPATGLYQYSDAKGSVVTSPTFPFDYNILINTSPKYYGGIQNSFRYKGIEIDFLFQFVKQKGPNYSFNNLTVGPGTFRAGTSNQPVTVLQRWQKAGDMTSVGYYTTGYNGYRNSDQSYTDASYIRLKNLSFTYNLPAKLQKLANFKSCKVFFQGQNLVTFTKWKGLDPETQAIYSLPPLRVLTVGIQLGL